MARDVLFRTLQLGIAVGVLIGGLIFAARGALPRLFSSDPRVHAIASRTLPVLGFMMVIGPSTAIASDCQCLVDVEKIADGCGDLAANRCNGSCHGRRAARGLRNDLGCSGVHPELVCRSHQSADRPTGVSDVPLRAMGVYEGMWLIAC